MTAVLLLLPWVAGAASAASDDPPAGICSNSFPDGFGPLLWPDTWLLPVPPRMNVPTVGTVRIPYAYLPTIGGVLGNGTLVPAEPIVGVVNDRNVSAAVDHTIFDAAPGQTDPARQAYHALAENEANGTARVGLPFAPGVTRETLGVCASNSTS